MSGTEIAKSSVRGSLVLFLGNFLSTVFSAVTVIILARLLGPEQYGVYALALVVPGILQLFIGFGILTAATRYSAYYVSIGRPEEAKWYTISAIVFILLCGAALSGANYVLAAPISTLVLHRSGIGSEVQLASLSVMGTAAFQATTSSAIGWNWADLAGLTNVIQSILRAIISPALILLGFGVYGAIAGQVTTLLLAGFLGVSFLYLRRLRKRSSEIGNMGRRISEMIRYGAPAFLGNALSGLAAYYITIVVAVIGSNATVGFYQAAANFTAPVSLISSAAASSLFPAFASLDGAGGDTRTAFRLSMKFVTLLIAPVIFLLGSSATLVIDSFYGPNYGPSVPLLQLLALSQLPLALGSTVLLAFFNGLGRTRLTLYSSIVGVVLLGVTAPLLSITMGFGVSGLVYALILSNSSVIAVAVLAAWTRMKAAQEARPLVLTLIASAASSLATVLLPLKGLPAAPALALSTFVFLGVYLTAAPGLRAINGHDIHVLWMTVGKLPFVSGLVSPILRYETLVMRLTGGER